MQISKDQIIELLQKNDEPSDPSKTDQARQELP